MKEEGGVREVRPDSIADDAQLGVIPALPGLPSVGFQSEERLQSPQETTFRGIGLPHLRLFEPAALFDPPVIGLDLPPLEFQ